MFFYNAPKEGNKFSLLACSDWDTANSRVEFSEAVFLPDEDFYYVFAYATLFKDVAKVGDRAWKFAPQLINFKIAKRDYKARKYDKDTEKWSEVDKEQSPAEKILCKILEGTKDDVFYKGFLELGSDPMSSMVLSGKNDAGQPLPDNIAEMVLKTRGCLTEISEAKEFTFEDVKLPEKKTGGYGKSGGQKELERLQDRVVFICDQLSKIGVEPATRDVYGIYVAMRTSEDAMAVVEIAKDLM